MCPFGIFIIESFNGFFLGSDSNTSDTVYWVIFIQCKFSDGWRIFENFQDEIKFGFQKFSQILPVSEDFSCRIFSVRMLAVDENYPMYGICWDYESIGCALNIPNSMLQSFENRHHNTSEILSTPDVIEGFIWNDVVASL